MSGGCYVYVVVAGDAIKVGVSTNPWSRACEMQTACPHKLRVFHAFRFPYRDQAFRYERHFHECHPDRRIQGEWFNLGPLYAVEFLADAIDQELWCEYRDIPLFLHAFREKAGINDVARLYENAA